MAGSGMPQCWKMSFGQWNVEMMGPRMPQCRKVTLGSGIAGEKSWDGATRKGEFRTVEMLNQFLVKFCTVFGFLGW